MASVSPFFRVSNIGTLFPNLIYSLLGKVSGAAENNNQGKAFSSFSDSAFKKKDLKKLTPKGCLVKQKKSLKNYVVVEIY